MRHFAALVARLSNIAEGDRVATHSSSAGEAPLVRCFCP
ncbi:MAG: hypothetical protein QOH71_3854 [Blastocatellia bacterium]|jgi:hypothetical protein|nr:hypothetical protein [Blastocatellia bacterium]